MSDSLRDTLAVVAKGEVIAVEFGHEGTGVLITAAQRATADAVDFMLRQGRSPVFLSLTPERIAALRIGHTGTGRHSALTSSLSLRSHEGPGAGDVARTIRRAVEAGARPEEFSRPGQVLTLRARSDGTLASSGEAELAVDLARLANLAPAGVISMVLGSDGFPANRDDLHHLADRYGLKLVRAADLLSQRLKLEPVMPPLQAVELPTDWGRFRAYPFTDRGSDQCHVALVVGDLSGSEPVLARIHSECLTGDAWHSHRCDCGAQLSTAMQAIQAAGRGVLLYLRQEGRGIGLANKMRAYALQDGGLDTVEANLALGLPVDARDYSVAAGMLRHLGVPAVRLMTNNPDKVSALLEHGVAVAERLPLIIPSNESNEQYLEVKRIRLHHWLTQPYPVSSST